MLVRARDEPRRVVRAPHPPRALVGGRPGRVRGARPGGGRHVARRHHLGPRRAPHERPGGRRRRARARRPEPRRPRRRVPEGAPPRGDPHVRGALDAHPITHLFPRGAHFRLRSAAPRAPPVNSRLLSPPARSSSRFAPSRIYPTRTPIATSRPKPTPRAWPLDAASTTASTSSSAGSDAIPEETQNSEPTFGTSATAAPRG